MGVNLCFKEIIKQKKQKSLIKTTKIQFKLISLKLRKPNLKIKDINFDHYDIISTVT